MIVACQGISHFEVQEGSVDRGSLRHFWISDVLTLFCHSFSLTYTPRQIHLNTHMLFTEVIHLRDTTIAKIEPTRNLQQILLLAFFRSPNINLTSIETEHFPGCEPAQFELDDYQSVVIWAQDIKGA
jgi:hypothetical protein